MDSSLRHRIVVLCGGGDCPGLNAVIRAVVKTAILDYGLEVLGSENSFGGFLDHRKMVPLTLESVRGILPRGGTILGTTNRGNPFHYPIQSGSEPVQYLDLSEEILKRAEALGLLGVIAIGGDGTLTIAKKLLDRGLPVLGVPKTIDNDLLATEVTFGFDTAVSTATEAIDRIHTTAESHERVMVVEVMGRNSGWIALEAGVAGGADLILIPEIPFRLKKICSKLQQRIRQGRLSSIVVVAEGAAFEGEGQIFQQEGQPGEGRLGGVGDHVARRIEQETGLECRVQVLGYLQRGGSPSPFDRLLATRFGVAVTDLAARRRFGRMVALRCGRIVTVPIEEAIAGQRTVDPAGELVRTARAIGLSFGGVLDSDYL